MADYLENLAGVREILADGEELPASAVLDFAEGLTASYDPETRRITVSASGAGTGGSSNVDDGVNGGDIPMWEPSLGRYVPVPFAGLAISSFSLTTSIVEVGETVTHPAFTAAYGGETPDTATLTDNQGSSPKDVTSTPFAFSSDAVLTKNTFGATAVFPLLADLGPLSATRSATLSWGQKTYYGVGAAGLSIASFLAGVPASSLKTARAVSFSVSPSSQKIYLLIRTGYGTPTIKDHDTGFGVAMTKTVSASSVTNAHAFAENYDLWEADNLLSGSINVDVT